MRLAVTGVTGRMGKSIIQRIIQTQAHQVDNKFILGAAIARDRSDICGIDAGTFVQSSKVGVFITDNIELVKGDFDVLIDFTAPESTMNYVNFCVMNNKNMVIGTTGLSKSYLSVIERASSKIGIVYSANFSVGITIMLKLLNSVSKISRYFVNIDIVESHHNKKKDIPSGTALLIRNVVEYNQFSDCVCNEDLVSNGEKKYGKLDNDIKIHSIRAGDIVGEHSVLCTSIGERLEIKHQAFNRIIFVDGALRSAVWLGCAKIGLFDLNNVLKINM
ncbi:dihydrodipicolinate reductase [Candidatus Blochmanniella floridana]|uniref:4-hydroxy-tetrahydrodipicolinate reductase n=1 Tax=Blochmanniella floridana TaxID=203907 RepID=DAPB_BLOFL|nr:RecName: Full=4-hydroxy-tetrahydrodipicolinate reductase; Short=HTPA reductase [Candidatus Blochmannia floridanus]CAD83642.1 dihydrodipicolinate reductase [Candidatus Blochmannia floridanus]